MKQQKPKPRKSKLFVERPRTSKPSKSKTEQASKAAKTTTESATQPATTKPPLPQKPKTAREVSGNLFSLLGGRRGILSLLDSSPSDDDRANALRDLLSSYDVDGCPAVSNEADGVDRQGETRKRMTFDLMYSRAGYTARDVWEMFAKRKNAEALVVATAAKPQVVAELIEDVMKKRVPCLECGGTKRRTVTDKDGDVVGYVDCYRCDSEGYMEVEGDGKARELYFEQFGFKQNGPLVAIDNRVDNRSVKFEAGMAGTAPSAASLIMALEKVKEQPALPAANVAANATGSGIGGSIEIVEAERV